MNAKPKPHLIIGIDPGLKTGLAIYSRRVKQIIHYETTDFNGLYEHFYSAKIRGQQSCYKIFCEDTSLNQTVFIHGNYARRKSTESIKQWLRIARNVGMNMRECQLVIGMLRLMGFDVVGVKPTKAKWNKEQLKRYTGIKSRTNEHVRDAIRMCWKG